MLITEQKVAKSRQKYPNLSKIAFLLFNFSTFLLLKVSTFLLFYFFTFLLFYFVANCTQKYPKVPKSIQKYPNLSKIAFLLFNFSTFLLLKFSTFLLFCFFTFLLFYFPTFLLSTVYVLLSTLYCLLSTVKCLLSTVECLLSSSIIRHPLSIIKISLLRRHAPMVRNCAFSHKKDYITIFRIFKILKDIKMASLVKELRWFCWTGGFRFLLLLKWLGGGGVKNPSIIKIINRFFPSLLYENNLIFNCQNPSSLNIFTMAFAWKAKLWSSGHPALLPYSMTDSPLTHKQEGWKRMKEDKRGWQRLNLDERGWKRMKEDYGSDISPLWQEALLSWQGSRNNPSPGRSFKTD